MARIVPYAALQFTVHEEMKLLLRTVPHEEKWFLEGVVGGCQRLLGVVRRCCWKLLHEGVVGSCQRLLGVVGRCCWKQLQEGVVGSCQRLLGVVVRCCWKQLQEAVVESCQGKEGVVESCQRLLGVVGRCCWKQLQGGVVGSCQRLLVVVGRCCWKQLQEAVVESCQARVLPPARRFLAGSAAGVTAVAITYPLDMVRARLAVSRKEKYSNLRNAFIRIYHDEGFRTFYRGITPTILGIMPYAGISFFTYETLKSSYHLYTDVKDILPHKDSRWCCAGILGQTSSYPLDIVGGECRLSPTG
eukprot:gene3802-15088_t